MAMSSVRIGVDIGGTFTDVTVLNEEDGNVTIAKVPSRKSDPGGALLDGVNAGLIAAGIDAASVTLLVHGTTIVTNAVLENKLPRTALITTKGFRDVLEIGRHFRPDMYDLQQDRVPPIIPRNRRYGLAERISAAGEVLVRPEEADFDNILESIKADNVEAVAICFLNSYVNPENEALVLGWLNQKMASLAVSASYDVCREMREFERVSTVSVNAAAIPLVAKYLSEITPNIRGVLPNAKVLLMQSNGGSLTVHAARNYPARILTSGPAGGALAVQRMSRDMKYPSLLGVDMGGTSTDISLIQDGELQMTTEADVAGRPIKLPMIAINTIGAGAGSIAWLDEVKGLHVGPHSAGSDPGPVAYGKGGTQPTVTDANIVLGRLLPQFFAGGRIELDVEGSRRAIKEQIGDPLDMSVEEAALGIVRIANANMERAVRVSSAEKGYDPRTMTMVAFGGAGPMHAAALAKSAGMPTVLVPDKPGVFSAVGLVMADIRHDFVRTWILRGEDIAPDVLKEIYEQLETLGREALDADAVPAKRQRLTRTADMRYVGQAYEINVTLPDGEIDAALIKVLSDRFHAHHNQLYAHFHPDKQIEFVSGRLIANGLMSAPPMRQYKTDGGGCPAKLGDHRIYFEEVGGYADTPIYSREVLTPGMVVQGPAVVVQLDTTIIIHPGQSATIDSHANLLIATGGEAHAR
ncbi:hydantoinase/oxoprolinase family protein [Chelativorans sp. ZYF759]|uniref:hydantoinase/oxoprolinase family protein n=1 Tax=Chelativorans sp. ZYF759 TaxID=2692213 RepID=UPI00145CEB15|nr:hydantoinase/oxoprolinase family protein [Chelativorans sp. ZYF759]NMG41464.1 hydantoinase/oxoprolinase family protein [Chelativorans sp. ZYF759]